jgi:hypothetical protein
MPRSSSDALARFALTLLLTLGPSGRALAAARPPEPIAVPLPSVLVEGAAQIDERRVHVACREIGVDAFTCNVEVRFRLVTSEPVRLRRIGDATWTVRGERFELASEDELDLPYRDAPQDESGSDGPQIVEVTLRFERSVSIGEVDREDFWVLAPLRGRHLLLGDGGNVQREGGTVYGELIAGSAITFAGNIGVYAEGPDAVSVNIGGHPVHGPAELTAAHSALILAAVPEPASEPSVVQHGGPVLAAGTRLDLSDEDDSRFLLRGAYELAVEGHFIGSISFETDFESIYESLVIEAASPEILVLLPSLSAGVGFVARQLGNRDADAALRLRVGMNFIAVGVTCDFDYWPSIGDWTGMVVGRISI